VICCYAINKTFEWFKSLLFSTVRLLGLFSAHGPDVVIQIDRLRCQRSANAVFPFRQHGVLLNYFCIWIINYVFIILLSADIVSAYRMRIGFRRRRCERERVREREREREREWGRERDVWVWIKRERLKLNLVSGAFILHILLLFYWL